MEPAPAPERYELRRRAVPARPDRPHSTCGSTSLAFLAFLGFLAAWTTCGGCATKAPLIDVEGVSIRSRTEDAVLVDVALTLRNENTGEVVLGEFEYDVAGSSTFSGRRRAALTLAPMSTERLVIPAVLRTAPDAGPPTEAVRVSGALGWRGSADLEKAFYDSGLYRPRASFGGTFVPAAGGVVVPGVAPISAPAAGEMSPTPAITGEVPPPEAPGQQPPTGSDLRPR